jgi:hypothetical protein
MAKELGVLKPNVIFGTSPSIGRQPAILHPPTEKRVVNLFFFQHPFLPFPILKCRPNSQSNVKLYTENPYLETSKGHHLLNEKNAENYDVMVSTDDNA